jgi:general stress protein 26
LKLVTQLGKVVGFCRFVVNDSSHFYTKGGDMMEKEELKKKIMQVIEEAKLASVATIRDGKPWVRYMVVLPKGDDLQLLYASTFAGSKKTGDVKKNNNIHITIGGYPNPAEWTKPYLNIQATAEIAEDVETKKEYWHEAFQQVFSGPEDPQYAIFKIFPQTIMYTVPGIMEPEVYEVG